MTKTLSALTLVAGLAFSGIALADPPGGAPAKPAATSGSAHSHGPKLKKVPGKKVAAQPGADKAAAPAPEAPSK
jgi:hypothetical protein